MLLYGSDDQSGSCRSKLAFVREAVSQAKEKFSSNDSRQRRTSVDFVDAHSFLASAQCEAAARRLGQGRLEFRSAIGKFL